MMLRHTCACGVGDAVWRNQAVAYSDRRGTRHRRQIRAARRLNRGKALTAVLTGTTELIIVDVVFREAALHATIAALAGSSGGGDDL